MPLGPSEVIVETFGHTESEDSDKQVNDLQNSQGNQGSQKCEVNSIRKSRFTSGTQVRYDTLIHTEQTTYGSGAENLEFFQMEDSKQRNTKNYLMDTDMSY